MNGITGSSSRTYGGGVSVALGGSFYLYGGAIRDCYAFSIDGASYGGGVAAVRGSEDGALTFENAPVQLLDGTITGCHAGNGGGAAFVDYPGSVVLGDIEITENFSYGRDVSSAGGVWYEPTEGFALYAFGSCRIADNVFYEDGAYTTGLEPVSGGEDASEEEDLEAPEPMRGLVLITLAEDAADRALQSDLRVPCTSGKDDPGCLRIGRLSGASIGLTADAETMAANDGKLYVTYSFVDSNPGLSAESVFFSDGDGFRVSGVNEVILRLSE